MNKSLVFIFLLILIALPFFFLNLGSYSLGDWDEAWYADISRNILIREDPINLWWNGRDFIDHPPAGFWFTALSYLVFGVSNFSARFPQAFFGLMTLVVIYLLGRKFQLNNFLSLMAAVSLSSANWFLFRARSGNLDISLTFFFVLTIYLAFKFTESKKFYLPFVLSFVFLLFSKTLVPFTVIPVIFLVFFKSKLQWKEYVKVFLVIFIIFGGWFLIKSQTNPKFVWQYFNIGLPGVSGDSSIIENVKSTKSYLHNGIGIWFWPSILGLILCLLSFKKKYMVLPIFFISFMILFIFSNRGHIWHMIPVYPFMILAFFVGSNYWITKLPRALKNISLLAVLLFSIYLSFLQQRRNWYEFIDRPQNISEIEILSREAGFYNENFYIDGDFKPSAIFYSGKTVRQISGAELKGVFTEDISFILITKLERLRGSNISEKQYKIIKEDKDRVLVLYEKAF